VKKRPGKPMYAIWHATRGPESGDQYLGTINWFVSETNVVNGSGPCADMLVGGKRPFDGKITVFTDYATERANWSAGYGASHVDTYGADEWGISIEVAQSAALEAYTPAQVEAIAQIMVALKAEFGIPFRRISYLDQRRDRAIPMGHVGHEDTANGRKTGKSDPGPKFPWVQAIVRAWEIAAEPAMSRPMIPQDAADLYSFLEYGAGRMPNVTVTPLLEEAGRRAYKVQLPR